MRTLGCRPMNAKSMTTALLLKIGAESSQLRGELQKANGMVNQFTSKITSFGQAALGAFTVSAVAGFVMEVSKLSAEAQGVRYAFDKIGGSVKLLHDLKEATHGTVSELELMKNAVAFKNFNLDVSQLPKLLEFATLRAQQTGQSVDYLVQSIVTGLGRKSVLILDNLGISSAMLNAEIAKTGDFFGAVGKIVDQEITNMGEHIENNITKTDRLSASWTNYKIAIGDAANSTGLLGAATDSLSGTLDVMSSKYLSFWEKVALLADVEGGPKAKAKILAATLKAEMEQQKKNAQVIREVDRAYKEFNKDIGAYSKAISTHIYKTDLLAEFQKRLNAEFEKESALIENEKNLTEQLNKKKEESLLLIGSARAKINDEIKGIEEKIKKLRELGAVENAVYKKPAGRISKGIISPNVDYTKNIMMMVKMIQPIDQFTQSLKFLNDQWMVVQTSMKTGEQTMKTFAQAWAEVGIAGIDATATINQGLASTAEGIGVAIGQMMSGIGGFKNIGAALLEGIAGTLQQLGQLAIATGFAIIGIKKALATLNPAVAIAAGVALIALSKFVSNKAGKIAGGGGSGSSGGGGSNGPGALTKIKYGERMEIGGEFKLSGPDLIAAIDNQYRRQNRTIPTKP